jgi:hypothetical protein
LIRKRPKVGKKNPFPKRLKEDMNSQIRKTNALWT